MVSASDKTPRGAPANSLFVKCTFMVFACVIAVVSVISVLEARAKTQMTMAALDARASEVTNLLAMQLGGAIKFGNETGVGDIVGNVMASAKPDALGAYVLSTSGQILYNDIAGNAAQELSFDLAQQALSQRAVVASEDGSFTAHPVFFGDAQEMTGVVLTAWTPEHTLATQAQAQRTGLLTGLGVLLIGLFVSGFFLKSQMSRPLTRIEAAMSEVAKANYDVNVPFTNRGDEIGKMARRLDGFREALTAAQATERESAFKSAAFEGSSAPMMMLDEDMSVIFHNPKFAELMTSLTPDITEEWDGFDPEDPAGARMSSFSMLSDASHKITTKKGAALPLVVTAKIGETLLEAKLSAAVGRDGTMIGTVVQFSDRTQTARNTALFTAIDTSQIRLEFNNQGTFLTSNSLATNLFRFDDDRATSPNFCSFFRGQYDKETSGQYILEAVLRGEPTSGRYIAQNVSHGQEKVLEGNFSAVTDASGQIERVIFLGTDRTDDERVAQQNKLEKEKRATDQKAVVEALGMALKSLSNGDLTCEITSAFQDEYEQLRMDFNAAISALNTTVSSVTQNAKSIREETGEISSAADDLSKRTEKQAATLEETAAALDELTSSVRSAADGADEASKMSADAQENAEQGGAVARLAVEAMDNIKTSSMEISKITSVIDDIAFQTNLLALNAGVEAARAGTAGRGFAVVATEVRALAQRSSDAAREINALISASETQVQNGVDLVDKTRHALAAIVTSVSDISSRVSSIAASATEQASGLQEINVAVNELDHVTQQNAAMFEETTAASHALTSETDALSQAVSQFTLGATTAAQEPAQFNSTKRRHEKPVQIAGALALNAEKVSASQTGWEEF